jgi:signal transduction histidine kinase
MDVKDASKRSFGIIGMHERIQQLRGSVKIESAISLGTTVTVRIPLEKKEANS